MRCHLWGTYFIDMKLMLRWSVVFWSVRCYFDGKSSFAGLPSRWPFLIMRFIVAIGSMGSREIVWTSRIFWANGYFRPPCLFFYIRVSFCLVLFLSLKPKYINKILLAFTIKLLIAIPTSISRSLFFFWSSSIFTFFSLYGVNPVFFLKKHSTISIGFLVFNYGGFSTDRFNTHLYNRFY
jgi:hypothetical protein